MAPEPAHLCAALQERHILRTEGCPAPAPKVSLDKPIENRRL